MSSATKKSNPEAVKSTKTAPKRDVLDSVAIRIRSSLYEWRAEQAQHETAVEAILSVESHRRRPNTILGKLHQDLSIRKSRLESDIQAVELLLEERSALLAKISSLSSSLQEAVSGLTRSKEQFSFYAKSHRAKKTPESVDKALVNESLVGDLEILEDSCLRTLRRK